MLKGQSDEGRSLVLLRQLRFLEGECEGADAYEIHDMDVEALLLDNSNIATTSFAPATLA